jgi:pSer/pThr/pTyr-binding forkhead associated (FHA) protein
MAKRAVITFMSGAEDGREATAAGTVISIGREEHNDIVVSYDSCVSRRHAQIELDGDQLRLSDLDSRNGTYLEDGTCIAAPTALAPGTIFRLGRTWLKVDLGD